MKRKISLLLLLVLLSVFTVGCRETGEESRIPPSVPEQAALPPEVLPAETAPPEEITILPAETGEPGDDALVRVLDYIPEIRQSLAYATVNNFTGQRIYDFMEAYLRYGTVKKLALVAAELEQQGLYLKIWDGFRPVSAQFTLWEVCPNPTYVANPNTGFSSHSRGNTVDLTLVDARGQEIEMPTGFDDFSALADRNYSDCTETAAANARLLQETMEKYGFSSYFGEWWHFSDTQSYPVEEIFEPAAG